MLRKKIKSKSLKDTQEQKCLEEKLELRAQKTLKNKNAKKKNQAKSPEDV